MRDHVRGVREMVKTFCINKGEATQHLYLYLSCGRDSFEASRRERADSLLLAPRRY